MQMLNNLKALASSLKLNRVCRGIVRRPLIAILKVLMMSFYCRLKAWYWPKNPGVSAAEVLTSPFFSPYAVLDVCRIGHRPSIFPTIPEEPLSSAAET